MMLRKCLAPLALVVASFVFAIGAAGLTHDAVHPNAFAHALAAERIASAILAAQAGPADR